MKLMILRKQLEFIEKPRKNDQKMVICCMKAQLAKVLNIKISTITCKRRVHTHIIAYNVHPNDQMSVLSSISAWLGQSHSSGARKGAEQCSDAHSYIARQVAISRLENPNQVTEMKL